MHEVGAGWLMTSLTTDPFTVALVQTATSLPIFLFALIAGAIADVMGRRRLLIYVQLLMAITAGVFTYIIFLDRMTPILLLSFVFLVGIGSAFSAPAKQAVVPQLVPKHDLQSAIALNSVGFNLSRTLGPAIAGLIIVVIGITAPFIYSAISFAIMAGAYIWWSPVKIINPLPKENIPDAIKTGVRYVYYSSQLRATLGRVFAFCISASAFWVLLPLLVKTELSGDASLFGMHIAAIGIGAVIGAFLLPKLKEEFQSSKIIIISSGLIVLVLIIAAIIENKIAGVLTCMVFGASWMCVLSTLNVSAQLALPDWVRARGLAIYLTVLFRSTSLGSIIWGIIASEIGVSSTMLIAASTLFLG
jgi:MFS family permease